MQEWEINFLNARKPLVIKGETFIAAVEEYIRKRQDLRYANLPGANLYCADLQGAYLTGTNLQGANVDYSCLPFSCHSLEVKIDKRIACQLLYHTLRAMQSVNDAEVKALLNDDKALALANQFHRVAECGSIVKEQSNE